MADDAPVKVRELLWLGDRAHARDKELLHRLGITHIVNVTLPRDEGGAHNVFEGQPGFAYLRIPVQDSDQAVLKPHFQEAIEFIDSAVKRGEGVLVHCQQGVSRSATIVLAYLIAKGEALADAYTHLRVLKESVKPKATFLRQLFEFESELQLIRQTKEKAKEDASVPVQEQKQEDEDDKEKQKATEEEQEQNESGDGKEKRKQYGVALPPHLLSKRHKIDED